MRAYKPFTPNLRFAFCLQFVLAFSVAIARAESSTKHWAYRPPTRPAVPAVEDKAWTKNAIDHFILARLEREALAPSPPADRARLIRRVYLDLIGLPPAVADVDAFLEDTRPGAYERLVDRLLASPSYGERWARQWLDLARYADSNGFQRDGHRQVWAYRDWVIKAFNAGLPFDRFTIEQLAGDLLPDATVDQRIATGFHRSTTVNVEAGVDQEENRVNAVIDRVNTTATVWLGTTMECAQCHAHKYDPFSQKDYYRLFAYFNSTEIETAGKANSSRQFLGPRLTLPLSPEQEAYRDELQARHTTLQKELEALTAANVDAQVEWERSLATDPGARKKLPAGIRKLLTVSATERSEKDKLLLRDHFLDLQPGVKKRRRKLQQLKKELEKSKAPTTLVMKEVEKPRETHIFTRGNFLSKGPRVEPGVPAALHALPQSEPPNRLGLARWFVAPGNPLIGRVTVNRWWAAFFGEGLVSSLEDFGTQSETPTHPELLDWLAVEFMQRGWSMKAMHKLMVTSATYRQSSRVSPELLKTDPQNKLHARGPRFRLNAEAVRDNALAISGLLSTKMGGSPVYPPQPPGIWTVTGVVDNTYRTSQGEDRYRRGIYTVWRRSSPYPSFVNFDAPDRSSCCTKRPRTNTPLQALTLMNDPVYVEMALALAARLLNDRPDLSVGESVVYGFRLCLSRRPKPEESRHLKEVYRRELARMEAEPAAARALVGRRSADVIELAAWFHVASILLNLDETITKG